jgi:hypothetical protein
MINNKYSLLIIELEGIHSYFRLPAATSGP